MHARKNRIIRQALTQENLQRFEPLWLKKAQIFVDRLGNGLLKDNTTAWTSPLDTSLYGEYMTSWKLTHRWYLR